MFIVLLLSNLIIHQGKTGGENLRMDNPLLKRVFETMFQLIRNKKILWGTALKLFSNYFHLRHVFPAMVCITFNIAGGVCFHCIMFFSFFWTAHRVMPISSSFFYFKTSALARTQAQTRYFHSPAVQGSAGRPGCLGTGI